MHQRVRLAAAALSGGLLAGLLSAPAHAAAVEQDVTVPSVVSTPAADPSDTTALEASSCYTALVAARFPGATDLVPTDVSVVVEQRTATGGAVDLSSVAQAWTFTLDDGVTDPVTAGCLLVDLTYGSPEAVAGERTLLDVAATASAGGARLRVEEDHLLRAAGVRSFDGLTSASVSRSRGFDPTTVETFATGLAARHEGFADHEVTEGDTYVVAPAERRTAQAALLRARLTAYTTYASEVAAADRAYAKARLALTVATTTERVSAKAVELAAAALERAKARAEQAGDEVVATEAKVTAAERSLADDSRAAATATAKASELNRKASSASRSRSAAARRDAAAYRAEAARYSAQAATRGRSAATWQRTIRALREELARWRRELGGRTVEQAQAAYDRAVALHERAVAELDQAQLAFANADAVRAAGVDAAEQARDDALAAAQATYDAAVTVTVTAETAGTARVWTTTTVA